MAGYDIVPQSARLRPEKFQVSVSEQELSDFKELLRLSRLAPQTYENLQSDGRFGVTHEWMSETKEYWETKYDWRATERYINSFPNFTAQIKDDDGEEYRVHFAALFSTRQNAIPVLFMHGWPGSFLEFLGLLAVFQKRYTPGELPYHIIAPSLPGYTLSSGPPLTRDFEVEDVARIMDKLMVGLGFGGGYVAQGGDVGSFTCCPLAAKHDACKAVHVNMWATAKGPPAGAETPLNEAETQGLQRTQQFSATGSAYSQEHATRPATIGFVLSSSPMALLAWIGEKFIQWTDETPPVKEILDSVTLYWFTQSFPRSIYPYRGFLGEGKMLPHDNPAYTFRKPLGYSWFPKELAPIPKAWVAATRNLVWSRQHSEGGHFAAMEKPELLATDVEDFLKQVWPVKG